MHIFGEGVPQAGTATGNGLFQATNELLRAVENQQGLLSWRKDVSMTSYKVSNLMQKPAGYHLGGVDVIHIAIAMGIAHLLILNKGAHKAKKQQSLSCTGSLEAMSDLKPFLLKLRSPLP